MKMIVAGQFQRSNSNWPRNFAPFCLKRKDCGDLVVLFVNGTEEHFVRRLRQRLQIRFKPAPLMPKVGARHSCCEVIPIFCKAIQPAGTLENLEPIISVGCAEYG